ncbi:MAG: type II toxin-antitoxin system RelE/ParE family toxin [Tepidisphaeraceae bacterium]|jgi:cytochrome P450
MKSILFDEARLEMLEAAQFYEFQVAGLGRQFLDAIERATADIEQYPRRWPAITRQVRRRLVGRFPYGVLYGIVRGKVIVIAIMHLHRHPRYWTKRLGKLGEI